MATSVESAESVAMEVDHGVMKTQLDYSDCGRPTVNFVARFKPGDLNFLKPSTNKTAAEASTSDEDGESKASKPSFKCSVVDAVIQRDPAMLRRLLAEGKEAHQPELPKMEVGGEGDPVTDTESWSYQAKIVSDAARSQLQMQINSAMVLAISARSSEMLAILMENGGNPDSFNLHFPLTHSAIYTKDVQLIETLLQHGATFGGSSTAGTAMHCAAISGSLPIVQKLAEHGLDINAKNSSDSLPLNLAIQQRHTDCAQFLIESGCATEEVDSLGRTSLHYAVIKGNYTIGSLLVQRGANVEAKDADGLTPWMLAAMNNRGMLMTLLFRTDQDVHQAVDADETTLLHCACQKGNELCARLLLLNGADPNRKNSHGTTPLMCAVVAKKISLVTLLIRVGHCDVTLLDNEGISALHLVVDRYDPKSSLAKKVAEILIAAGASVNQAYSGKTVTPLMEHIGDVSKGKLLLQLGADPNLVSCQGHTALWRAVDCHRNSVHELRESLANLFQEANADVRLSSLRAQPDNITPLQRCLETECAQAAQCLLNYDCCVDNVAPWLKSDQAKELKQSQRSPEMKQVIERVEQRCSKPRSLLDNSRLAVLGALGSGTLKPKVEQLGLPRDLKSYLHWQNYWVWNDITQV